MDYLRKLMLVFIAQTMTAHKLDSVARGQTLISKTMSVRKSSRKELMKIANATKAKSSSQSICISCDLQ
jgi:hypothetical protein